MGSTNNYGCLALLFGLRKPENSSDRVVDEDYTEGDIHSGPGGYEGMGYTGGYAADYFSQSDEH